MKMDSATIKTRAIDTVKSQGALVMLVVLCVVAAVRFPDFATPLNLANISRQVSMSGLLAIGMAFVILSGGIDLSVGSIAALTSIVAVQLSGWFGPAAVVAPILIGVAIGGFNGVLITWGRIPPFIVTLAMMLGVRGLAFILAGEDQSAAAADQVVKIPGWFLAIFRGDCFGIPYPAIILMAALGVAIVVSKYTSFGRSVFAVGGSEEAARMMGLNAGKCKMLVYMICGGCAGVAGLLLASRLKAIDPTATPGWELTAIAAVVIGGIPLTGGLGKIGHVIYGVLILGIIPNLINHLKISLPPWYNEMITGMLLLAVVLLQARIAKNNSR